MAKANTLRFSKFKIELGDGANPETFSAPCGMNSRGLTRTAATNETNVPDCEDDDAPSNVERDVTSLSSTISGAGVVDDDDFGAWEDFYESGDSKNVKITRGTKVYIGAYICTNLAQKADRGARVTFDVTLESDGPLVRQP